MEVNIMKNQKTRRSHTRRVVLSAMAVLAVSSSVLAPAFYSADLFRGITASAEAVEVDSGTVNNTILWKFYDDGTLWVSGEGCPNHRSCSLVHYGLVQSTYL